MLHDSVQNSKRAAICHGRPISSCGPRTTTSLLAFQRRSTGFLNLGTQHRSAVAWLENKHCKNWFKRIAIVILAYLLEVLADRMEYTMFSQLRGPPWSELSHLSQLPVRRKKNYMDIAIWKSWNSTIIWTFNFQNLRSLWKYLYFCSINQRLKNDDNDAILWEQSFPKKRKP